MRGAVPRRRSKSQWLAPVAVTNPLGLCVLHRQAPFRLSIPPPRPGRASRYAYTLREAGLPHLRRHCRERAEDLLLEPLVVAADREHEPAAART